MLRTHKFSINHLFLAATCCLLIACGDSANVDNQNSVAGSVSSATNTLPAGVTLLERIEANSGELLIPYSKFQLENGLTVIIHEDHSDPLVRVDVTYHVGSAREEPRRSGFAHFFEHMMFQGSEHVGDDEHFRIVTESGGL